MHKGSLYVITPFCSLCILHASSFNILRCARFPSSIRNISQ